MNYISSFYTLPLQTPQSTVGFTTTNPQPIFVTNQPQDERKSAKVEEAWLEKTSIGLTGTWLSDFSFNYMISGISYSQHQQYQFKILILGVWG